MFQVRVVLAAMFVAAGVAVSSAATPQRATAGAVGAVGTTAEPLAPIAPETVSRDDAGHMVMRAIRLASPLRLDGKLDEAVYAL